MSNILTKDQKKEITCKLLTGMLSEKGRELADRSKDLAARWTLFNEERVLAEYPFLTLEQGKILRQSHAAVSLTGAVKVKWDNGGSFLVPGHGEFYSVPKDRKRDVVAYDALKTAMQGTTLTMKFSRRESRYNESVKWYQEQDYPYLLHVRCLQMPMHMLEQGEWPSQDMEMLHWARKAIGLVLESKQLSEEVGELYGTARGTYEEIEPILASISTFSKLGELFPEAASVCPNKPEKIKAVMDVEHLNKVRGQLKKSTKTK